VKIAERVFLAGLEKGELDLSLLLAGVYWVKTSTGNGTPLMLKK